MSEQSADNQGGLKEAWKKTLGRITKKITRQSKVPQTPETQVVENRTSRLTGPIGSFAQLGQRYRDLFNVVIGVDIIQNADSQLITDWWRYVAQNADRQTAGKDLSGETKVKNPKNYLLNDHGAQAFKITPEQAEAAANIYLTFSDLLKQYPFDYQSHGYNKSSFAVISHLGYLKFLIEHLAKLPPDKLAELIKQKYEWDINPATIRRKELEVGEAERAILITKDSPDVDYKTAIKNKSDLEAVQAGMKKRHPEQIHMLKFYEKAFAPYFQRQPGFGTSSRE